MDGQERRGSKREQVELRATIESVGEQPAFDTVVRNISASGARLEGANLDSTPETFDLTITQDSGQTETRRARLVWRTEGAVGVNFSDYIGA